MQNNLRPSNSLVTFITLCAQLQNDLYFGSEEVRHTHTHTAQAWMFSKLVVIFHDYYNVWEINSPIKNLNTYYNKKIGAQIEIIVKDLSDAKLQLNSKIE